MSPDVKALIREARANLLATIDPAVAAAQDAHRMRQRGQGSIFADAALPEERPLMTGKEISWLDVLAMEKEALGFYLSGHPVDEYPAMGTSQIADLAGKTDGQEETVLVLVEEVGYHTTKAGKPFARLMLSDRTGEVEAVLWSEALETCRDLLRKNRVLRVTGRVEKRTDHQDDSPEAAVRTSLVIREAREAKQ